MKRFLFIKKTDNKGFSLVELVIVVAIMAVLVGVVGTQVLPYIEKSKRERDLEMLSAYVTAGMSAYSLCPDNAPVSGIMRIRVAPGGDGRDVYTGMVGSSDTPRPELQEIADKLKELIVSDHLSNARQDFQSNLYSELSYMEVVFDFDSGVIAVRTYRADNVEIIGESPIQGRL